MYQRAARGLGLSEDEDVALFAATHEVALVVGQGAEKGAGHQGFAVIGQFGDESVGTAATVEGAIGLWGGGEIERVCTAGDNDIVVTVAVDAVHCIVLDSTKIGAPDHVAEIVVDLEDHTILPSLVDGLHATGRYREVGREGCGTHIDIVEVVGDYLATGAVAVVIVKRIVAYHHGVAAERVAVVEAVVATATHVGGGQQGAAVAAETAYEDVDPVWEINGA